MLNATAILIIECHLNQNCCPLLAECAADFHDGSECERGLLCRERDPLNPSPLAGCTRNHIVFHYLGCNGMYHCYVPDWDTAASCNGSAMFGVDWDDLHSSSVESDGNSPSQTLSVRLGLESPDSMSPGHCYRSCPLVQEDFAIAMDRSVNVMASSGVGTVTAECLVASFSSSSVPKHPHSLSLKRRSFGGIDQIFTVTIPAECSSDDSVVDLRGDWNLAFTPQCLSDDDAAACDTFMADLDGSGKVALDLTDDCAVNLFNVIFEAALTFCSDSFVVGTHTVVLFGSFFFLKCIFPHFSIF